MLLSKYLTTIALLIFTAYPCYSYAADTLGVSLVCSPETAPPYHTEQVYMKSKGKWVDVQVPGYEIECNVTWTNSSLGLVAGMSRQRIDIYMMSPDASLPVNVVYGLTKPVSLAPYVADSELNEGGLLFYQKESKTFAALQDEPYSFGLYLYKPGVYIIRAVLPTAVGLDSSNNYAYPNSEQLITVTGSLGVKLTTTSATGRFPFTVEAKAYAYGLGSEDTVSSYEWFVNKVSKSSGISDKFTYNVTGPGRYILKVAAVSESAGNIKGEAAVTIISKGNQAPSCSIQSRLASSKGIKATARSYAITSDATDADGSIKSYNWDFGNGKTADGKSSTVAYAAAGTYTVSLTVTDNEGTARTCTRKLKVL